MCFSINGDGAAEPVSDTFTEGEDKTLDEDFSSSWPTTLTSAPTDAKQSDVPKQVWQFVSWTVILQCCNQNHQTWDGFIFLGLGISSVCTNIYNSLCN